MSVPSAPEPPAPSREPRWGRVYLLVLASQVLVVVALALFGEVFT